MANCFWSLPTKHTRGKCTGGSGGEGRLLISGSQNNCLLLFLICAENLTGYHTNNIEKGCPKEKRRKVSPRVSHLHTLQLDSSTWDYEGNGRVDLFCLSEVKTRFQEGKN